MDSKASWILALATLTTNPALALPGTCRDLPNHQALSKALSKIVIDGNGGLFTPNAMWATIVGRDGVICAVAKSGDAWPGSRVISAQKAYTANAFSNERLSLSTGKSL